VAVFTRSCHLFESGQRARHQPQQDEEYVDEGDERLPHLPTRSANRLNRFFPLGCCQGTPPWGGVRRVGERRRLVLGAFLPAAVRRGNGFVRPSRSDARLWTAVDMRAHRLGRQRPGAEVATCLANDPSVRLTVMARFEEGIYRLTTMASWLGPAIDHWSEGLELTTG
jgi:hypothetical protein